MSVDQEETVETRPDVPEDRPKRTRRRLSRRATVVLVGGLVLLLAGGGFALWALVLRPSTQSTTTYRTVTVATETLKESVSATGTLQPARESALGFSSAGTVTAVDVAVGDTVAKGDKLATIDDSALQIDIDAAEAALTQAEQTLSDLEDDDDSTTTEIAAATAAVKVKKSAVAQADDALDGAELTAPFAGRVAAVGIADGDTVGSSGGGGSASSTSSAKTITLISDGTFVVDTSVSIADVTKIKKGLQATITPTGATDPVFGTVSSVDIVASSSSGTTSGTTTGSSTFGVTIKVTGRQKSLLPGSSVTAAITVKQLSDVIAVPTQAIATQNGATIVQKLVNGAQVATPVTLGTVVGASTVITKGLQVGDQVVMASFTVSKATSTNQQQQQSGGFGGQGGPPAGGPGGGVPGTGTGGQGGNR